uniref:Uncharacterized protein n=1 Tax=Pseudo-nitzschia delicatissima TaxID=44447 RepID=A0A7S0Y6W0_9STRA|mmetsp:Transcript_957/g.1940  ORF Transcript_957/g.1940 Transcript_957/m.1940 type:complete len:247 (+) Transcript_957:129-869(+)
MTMSTSQSNSRDTPIVVVKNNDLVTPIDSVQRSKNIPLPLSHKHRTESEMQLCEDMETAEQRDLNMFYRLVNGIRDRQMTLVRENDSSTAAAAFYDPAHALTEAERSLAHIIHTRNAPVEKKNVTSATTSIRINTGRRNNCNNFLSNLHTNLNAGVPLREGHFDSIHPLERPDRESEWFVGGFDSSSNLSSCDQSLHRQQQQHSSANCGFATATNLGIAGAANSTTLYKTPSSSEIAEEGMFDFEL